MQWLHPYRHKVDQLYRLAEMRMAEFPECAAQPGLALLKRLDQARAASKDNHICCLLPYWLADSTQAREEWCDRMALGNLFGMLHYLIIDDAMDAPAQPHGSLLPLAGLCNLELFACYQPLLTERGEVWSHYQRYVSEWAAAAAAERAHNRRWSDPLTLAHKSSPIKLTAAALCALAGREELLEEFEAAIDLVLATLQLSDDLADWEQDLAEDSGNALLLLIRSGMAEPDKPLTAEAVKQAIFVSQALVPYLEVAERHHRALSELAISDSVPGLVSFHNSLLEELRDIALRVSREREQLLQGGFHYWLYKQ